MHTHDKMLLAPSVSVDEFEGHCSDRVMVPVVTEAAVHCDVMQEDARTVGASVAHMSSTKPQCILNVANRGLLYLQASCIYLQASCIYLQAKAPCFPEKNHHLTHRP